MRRQRSVIALLLLPEGDDNSQSLSVQMQEIIMDTAIFGMASALLISRVEVLLEKSFQRQEEPLPRVLHSHLADIWIMVIEVTQSQI